jgi:cytidyltransferase-like protein
VRRRVVYAAAVQRKIGVMGGTFDPIHHGHLVAASEVADRFGLDEVVFVPTGQPWQKSERQVSRAEDRYLMTVVATASNPRFSVSRVDIDRGGPTYTADTLTDLSVDHPDARLYFITGADALAQILSWQKWTGCSSWRTSSVSPARATPWATTTSPRARSPWSRCRHGHLLHRLPAAGRRRAPGLVPGAGRGGPVHLQTPALPPRDALTSGGIKRSRAVLLRSVLDGRSADAGARQDPVDRSPTG